VKIQCNVCKFSSSISWSKKAALKCRCSVTWKVKKNNLQIQYLETNLSQSYKQIYQEIAKIDLKQSIQNSVLLNQRALEDLRNIGKVKGLKVLEIGPGLGDLTQLLIGAGAQVYVADLVPSYLNQLQKFNCKKILADAQNLTIIDYFDIVIACDVIEHVLRPADLLISINRSLKSGGYLYLRCPQLESLNTYSNLNGYEYEIVHLRSFTKKLLKNELMDSGFYIKKFLSVKTAKRFLGSFLFNINFYKNNEISLARIELINKIFCKFVNMALGQFNQNKNWTRKIFKPLLNLIRKLLTYSSEIAVIAKKI
jgi:2-polyprenyl-3-methyl-5-hydroxy-6-metoxy-1,4-benzoquinol methylase